MKIENIEIITNYLKDLKHSENILCFDKIDEKKIDIPMIYEDSIEGFILIGDAGEYYELDDLELIDERLLKTKLESEKRHVLYMKGEFESVHWSSRGKTIKIDGFYANDQSPYADTTFTNSLLSAKTWKRKKDAENRLKALISTHINKHKSVSGEVITITITMSY